MDESILNTVKTFVGVSLEDDSFDGRLITHINTALNRLFQIGIGTEAVVISDDDSTWSSEFGTMTNLQMIKEYICNRVQIAFDPSLNPTILKSQQDLVSELEWSIQTQVEIIDIM